MFGFRLPSPPPVRTVSVESAHDLMQQGVPLIDVREPAEVAEAAVPGAIHVPLSEIERDGPAALARRGLDASNAATLLLFCRSGNRSGIAARLLASAFGERLANVEGGILAWAARGLPIQCGR